MGYCPFPVLCHDTTVVSRQEGRDARCRLVCSHDQGPALAHEGVPGKACRNKPPWVLCRDRESSVATELAHPMSRQRFLASRQGFGQLGFWYRDSDAA